MTFLQTTGVHKGNNKIKTIQLTLILSHDYSFIRFGLAIGKLVFFDINTMTVHNGHADNIKVSITQTKRKLFGW